MKNKDNSLEHWCSLRCLQVAAFVMPNQPIDSKKHLLDFIVPLENLESVAGLRFFPKRLPPDSASYTTYKTREQRYFKSSLGRQEQLALPGGWIDKKKKSSTDSIDYGFSIRKRSHLLRNPTERGGKRRGIG